jgi:hypothetical protein
MWYVKKFRFGIGFLVLEPPFNVIFQFWKKYSVFWISDYSIGVWDCICKLWHNRNMLFVFRLLRLCSYPLKKMHCNQ